jgi:hypothetical protein
MLVRMLSQRNNKTCEYLGKIQRKYCRNCQKRRRLRKNLQNVLAGVFLNVSYIEQVHYNS